MKALAAVVAVGALGVVIGRELVARTRRRGFHEGWMARDELAGDDARTVAALGEHLDLTEAWCGLERALMLEVCDPARLAARAGGAGES